MRTLTSANCIGYWCRENVSRSSASNSIEIFSMLRLEKGPPAPKVTSSNPPLRLLREGAASMNNRIACSMSRLTDVPDSDARCFSFASRLSSRVIVVRMMHDHTISASVHQEALSRLRQDHEIQENAHKSTIRHAQARTVRGRTDLARFRGYVNPSSSADRRSWGNVAS